jgi:hypothetical protein
LVTKKKSASFVHTSASRRRLFCELYDAHHIDLRNNVLENIYLKVTATNGMDHLLREEAEHAILLLPQRMQVQF